MTDSIPTIRRANREDALKVWNVRARAIESHCRSHYSADQIAKWAATPLSDRLYEDISNGDFIVADVNGTIAGFGFLDHPSMTLEALFVSPDWQRRGVASRLLSALEDSARATGLTKIKLSSSLNAVAFYEHAGYTVGERSVFHHPRGFDLECVIMQKQLAVPPA